MQISYIKLRRQSQIMNIYLSVIGIISTISCILIIICINSKSRDPNSFPSEESKSPIKKQGLTEAQKSQLLLIVCLIFFMSLITTNVKTSKFSVIIENWFSPSVQVSSKRPADVSQIFYGDGNCKFQNGVTKYPNLITSFKSLEYYKGFLNKLLAKNYNQQSPQSIQEFQGEKGSKIRQQLRIFKSSRRQLGQEYILPMISQRICKSSQRPTPVIYLDLKKKNHSEQGLMDLIRMDSYDIFKQTVCKLNGIHIQKSIQKQGGFNFEKDTYSQMPTHQGKSRNLYLILNNFQYITQTLIFSTEGERNKKQSGDSGSHKVQNADFISQKIHYYQPKYELFIDKLFNELIKQCKINVILHSSRKQEVNSLYLKWELLITNKPDQGAQNSGKYSADFPFTVEQWKGLPKIQFYQLLKEMISLSSELKDVENSIWKLFQKSFGSIAGPNQQRIHKVGDNYQQNRFVQNDFEITFDQLEQFFTKIQKEKENTKHSDKTLHNQKKASLIVDVKLKIAEHYGLQNAYSLIRTFSQNQSGFHTNGVRLGVLKRKTSLKQINRLQQLGFLFIKQGRVYLIN